METDIEVTQQNINKSQKILENNCLYILLPDGTRYDSTGKKVE